MTNLELVNRKKKKIFEKITFCKNEWRIRFYYYSESLKKNKQTRCCCFFLNNLCFSYVFFLLNYLFPVICLILVVFVFSSIFNQMSWALNARNVGRKFLREKKR
ncbi:hypothetical protein ABEB36_003288 [Hypothenemus hampei]|uniref:Transmembrane protein n=1 Tax=Hypothenemus hampei TaxID=57062 RepID=A0ABD1F8Q1_HYPHA